MPINNSLKKDVDFLSSIHPEHSSLVLDSNSTLRKEKKRSQAMNFLSWFIHLITFTLVPRNRKLDQVTERILEESKELESPLEITVDEKNLLQKAIRNLKEISQLNGGSKTSKIHRLLITIDNIKTLEPIKNLSQKEQEKSDQNSSDFNDKKQSFDSQDEDSTTAEEPPVVNPPYNHINTNTAISNPVIDSPFNESPAVKEVEPEDLPSLEYYQLVKFIKKLSPEHPLYSNFINEAAIIIKERPIPSYFIDFELYALLLPYFKRDFQVILVRKLLEELFKKELTEETRKFIDAAEKLDDSLWQETAEEICLIILKASSFFYLTPAHARHLLQKIPLGLDILFDLVDKIQLPLEEELQKNCRIKAVEILQTFNPRQFRFESCIDLFPFFSKEFRIQVLSSFIERDGRYPFTQKNIKFLEFAIQLPLDVWEECIQILPLPIFHENFIQFPPLVLASMFSHCLFKGKENEFFALYLKKASVDDQKIFFDHLHAEYFNSPNIFANSLDTHRDRLNNWSIFVKALSRHPENKNVQVILQNAVRQLSHLYHDSSFIYALNLQQIQLIDLKKGPKDFYGLIKHLKKVLNPETIQKGSLPLFYNISPPRPHLNVLGNGTIMSPFDHSIPSALVEFIQWLISNTSHPQIVDQYFEKILKEGGVEFLDKFLKELPLDILMKYVLNEGKEFDQSLLFQSIPYLYNRGARADNKSELLFIIIKILSSKDPALAKKLTNSQWQTIFDLLRHNTHYHFYFKDVLNNVDDLLRLKYLWNLALQDKFNDLRSTFAQHLEINPWILLVLLQDSKFDAKQFKNIILLSKYAHCKAILEENPSLLMDMKIRKELFEKVVEYPFLAKSIIPLIKKVSITESVKTISHEFFQLFSSRISFQSFYNNERYSDLSISVNGTKLFAHQIVLQSIPGIHLYFTKDEKGNWNMSTEDLHKAEYVLSQIRLAYHQPQLEDLIEPTNQKTLQRSFLPWFNQPEYSDYTICTIENGVEKKIYLHRLILEASDLVFFKALFSSSMRDSTHRSLKVESSEFEIIYHIMKDLYEGTSLEFILDETSYLNKTTAINNSPEEAYWIKYQELLSYYRAKT